MTLSQSLRDYIPFMLLQQEMKSKGIQTVSNFPNVYINAFKDNFSALELVHTPKLLPYNKLINFIYHHLQSYFRGIIILIFPNLYVQSNCGLYYQAVAAKLLLSSPTETFKMLIPNMISNNCLNG